MADTSEQRALCISDCVAGKLLKNMNTTLIVEDNDVFRQTLKNVLSRWFPSMDLQEARHGKEALEKVTALRPELIFIDIKLP